MTDRAICRKITGLSEAIEENLVLCLLLFRRDSKRYIHRIEQEMLDNLQHSCREETDSITPWEIIEKGRKESFRNVVHDLVCAYDLSPDIERYLMQTFWIDDSNIDFVCELVDFLSDVPADKMAAVEECFGRLLLKWCNGEEDMHGDLHMPKEIMQCMIEALDIQGGSIYDPCCGSACLLLAALAKADENPKCRLFGQAAESKISMIAKLSLAVQGADYFIETYSASAVQGDLFPHKSFDYVLANPPFNYKLPEDGYFDHYDPRWMYGLPSRGNCNFAWLQHIIYHMNERGKAAVIMPNSTLSSSAARDKEIREAIIQAGVVEAIIVFPKYLFHGTEVPFCMWLLNKDNLNKDNVLFLDVTRSIYGKDKDVTQIMNYVADMVADYRSGKEIFQSSAHAVASIKQISESGYMLSPNLYLLSDYQITAKSTMNMLREELGQLEDIPAAFRMQMEEWYTIQPATSWFSANLIDAYIVTGGISKSKDAIGHGYSMVDTAMVIKNRFIPDAFTQYIDADVDEQYRFRILEGDVIMNRTSETISSLACCCVADRDCNAVFSGYTKRLRPINREILDPSYMAGFFSSEIYRKQIVDLSPAFTTRASINNDTLSKIHIYYPNRELQKKLGNILHGIYEIMILEEQLEARIRLQKIWDILVEQFITLPILKQMREGGMGK